MNNFQGESIQSNQKSIWTQMQVGYILGGRKRREGGKGCFERKAMV